MPAGKTPWRGCGAIAEQDFLPCEVGNLYCRRSRESGNPEAKRSVACPGPGFRGDGAVVLVFLELNTSSLGNRTMKGKLLAAIIGLVLIAAPAAAKTLRIGLAEDPDTLDPTLSRFFVSRIVFAAMCDKLLDITPKLEIVPQLATAYSWSADNKALTLTLRQGVRFQDGEPFDAAAAKFSIERHLGSSRKSEISAVRAVEVIDAHTIRLDLSTPFAPLLSQLADRAGMMLAPKAAEDAGDKFGASPVCVGPYKFKERVPQDRIVLTRDPRLLAQGPLLLRRGRLPPDPGQRRPARQSAIGRPRFHRARRRHRHAGAERGETPRHIRHR